MPPAPQPKYTNMVRGGGGGGGGGGGYPLHLAKYKYLCVGIPSCLAKYKLRGGGGGGGV